MKNLKFLEIEKIFMCSDIHGEYGQFLNNIQSRSTPNITEKQEKKEDEGSKKTIKLSSIFKKREKLSLYNDSLIILCGDCGFGFNKLTYYENTLKEINNWLVNINANLICFRGNHDDPSYFKTQKLDFSNIKLIDDYTVVSTKNHNILCVGGGLSIDKSWRLTRESQINRFKVNEKSMKKLFWEDENFIFDKDQLTEIKDSGIEIDIIATHIAPNLKRISYDKENIKYWLRCNEVLKLDIEMEKNKMKQFQGFIFKNFDIKIWFSGHLHTYNLFNDKKTIFCQLPCETSINEYVNVDGVLSSFDKKEETIKVSPTSTLYSEPAYLSFTQDFDKSLLDELVRISGQTIHRQEPIDIGQYISTTNLEISTEGTAPF